MRYRLILFNIRNTSVLYCIANNLIEWAVEDVPQILIEFFDVLVISIRFGQLVEEFVFHVQHPFRLVNREIPLMSEANLLCVKRLGTKQRSAFQVLVLQDFVSTIIIFLKHATSGDAIGGYGFLVAQADGTVVLIEHASR